MSLDTNAAFGGTPDGQPVVSIQDISKSFGGVHAVRFDPSSGHIEGVGDSRRGGVAVEV